MTTKNSFTDKIVKAKCSDINFLNLLDGKKWKVKQRELLCEMITFASCLSKMRYT